MVFDRDEHRQRALQIERAHVASRLLLPLAAILHDCLLAAVVKGWADLDWSVPGALAAAVAAPVPCHALTPRHG